MLKIIFLWEGGEEGRKGGEKRQEWGVGGGEEGKGEEGRGRRGGEGKGEEGRAKGRREGKGEGKRGRGYSRSIIKLIGRGRRK